MAEVPFELRYELTRRQRLIPHLKVWGPHSLLVLLVLAALLASLAATWWAGLWAFLWAWVFRNFFRGLAGVVVYKTVPMDLRVEGNGLGVLIGGERWWVFLDGLVSIKQLTPGV